MSGKHARRASALRAALRVAWVGTRELVVYAAIGVVAPIALLVSLPSLLEDGRSMVDAPTCEAGGRDCLEPRQATLAESTGDTWTFDLTDGADVELTFPRRVARPFVNGELHVLFWNDDPVALLQADGHIAESTDWGPLYGLNTRAFLYAPLWPLAVLGLAAPLLWRRRPYLRAVAVIAVGGALAGPTAYAGMWLGGYRGLVVGGLLPLSVTLLVSGLTLLVARPPRRRPAPRRATPTHQPLHLPTQRSQARETADVS